MFIVFFVNLLILQPEAPIEKILKTHQPFKSEGYRLDGKPPKRTRTPLVSESEVVNEVLELRPLVPDNTYKPGHLSFPRYNYKNRVSLERELAEKQNTTTVFKPFEGTGYTIRSSR